MTEVVFYEAGFCFFKVTDDIEKSCFSGSIGPQNADNVALSNLKRCLGQDGGVCIGEVNVLRREFFHQYRLHTGLILRCLNVLYSTKINKRTIAAVMSLLDSRPCSIICLASVSGFARFKASVMWFDLLALITPRISMQNEKMESKVFEF